MTLRVLYIVLTIHNQMFSTYIIQSGRLYKAHFSSYHFSVHFLSISCAPINPLHQATIPRPSEQHGTVQSSQTKDQLMV